ncbi:MAG: bifunctional riboflavin kinase/FAD synthetase [Peptococcaceae bacterium]|nr:bifunctional riboflavin kinase/FAD synthetase [Peptococcaceae bacterium]MDH7524089.1 bifunctional riboflavin kinase/FAD synthetase [Peptococcaceae bacterium]
MEIVRSLEEIRAIKKPRALALGNFDGVHRGHQVLIRQCVEESRRKSWVPCALTFEPHPLQVIKGNGAVKLLNTFEQKRELIASLGISYLILLTFDRKLAGTAAEDFVKNYLAGTLETVKVFVGFNFSFGRDGSGNPAFLEMMGKECGFETSVIPPVLVDNKVVSSSIIREYYSSGQLDQAAKMLGYQPFLLGMVVPGESRGRIIGYPTANIETPDYLVLPAFGVYAAWLEILNNSVQSGVNKKYPAVVNIGRRPTFSPGKPSVEAHIPCYTGDLYHQQVKLTLLERVRPEMRFENMEKLREQIAKDIRISLQILKQHPSEEM